MTYKSNHKQDKNEWLERLQSSIFENQSRPESKYLQLATVNQKNHPEVRTLVFRECLESSSTLIMHTDIRSDKISQIHTQNCAQICWYFSVTREQYRFTGSIKIIDASQDDKQSQRKQHWLSLSTPAKTSYFWQTPGESLALNQAKQSDEVNRYNIINDDNDSISDNFALLSFAVSEVDHLQLNTTPHTRKRYQLKHHLWQEDTINP
ncbi:pyridoxamine 5'-phosphate oxidase family protein [Aliiglaciecola lipolytica]|uniref:PH domain-containing protein n=1 Tax=Aliiglaciecola lipolytica E3 TaxID=1127673 RepID=K6XZ95_9ALTE|nr:pyridoxamine 5'-phosphate oxidase family protein [Aliiglaciecola lipolytica]GAC16981.1 hypothetical protein GLIP_4370 [Aliiglaciecola lipolytica E3]